MCYSARVRGGAGAEIGGAHRGHSPAATPRVRRGRGPGAAPDRRSLQGPAQVLDGGHQQLGARRLLTPTSRE